MKHPIDIPAFTHSNTRYTRLHSCIIAYVTVADTRYRIEIPSDENANIWHVSSLPLDAKKGWPSFESIPASEFIANVLPDWTALSFVRAVYANEAGYLRGHRDGYDEGHKIGHSDGYDEGYEDGSEGILED